MSEAVLDHGKKVEGYLQDTVKAKAIAKDVKMTEIQLLVEALSKVTTGVQPNATAFYEPIVSLIEAGKELKGWKAKQDWHFVWERKTKTQLFCGSSQMV